MRNSVMAAAIAAVGFIAVPWVITGRHEFKITTPEDPALRKAAVQWQK